MLRNYDKQFQEYKNRGKGSHRIIYHPNIAGQPVSYPMVCHGEGKDVLDVYLKALTRRFNLPADFF